MSNVLVVAEVSGGVVSKPTLELLTAARRIGEPVAVVFGAAGEGAATLGEYGATRVVEVNDPAFAEYLVAPQAEALAQLAGGAESPAAILLASSLDNKEIAGRLAVKLDCGGVITDAWTSPPMAPPPSRCSPVTSPCRRRSPRDARSSP